MPRYDPQPTDIWSVAIMFCCMTLRWFPWKAPCLSDNSFKLFLFQPTDNQRPRSLIDATTGARSESASRVPSDKPSSMEGHHHKQDGSKSDPVSRTNDTPRPETSSSTSGASQPPQVIKGPWRLLRLLPCETRRIIGRMLEVDPKKRATLEEVLADPWVQKAPVCRQEEGGRVIRAGEHEHMLEPNASTKEPSAQSKTGT